MREVPMSKPILAWHFLTERRVPDMGTRRKPLYVGHLWREKGPPVLCERGLHASERILDALKYAPGPVVCRVEVSGTIVRGADKLVGTRRRILAMGDITNLLHEWACDVAEDACARAGVKDPRLLAAIACKRRWIRGEATDGELDAARNDAWVSGDYTLWRITNDVAWRAANEAACCVSERAAGSMDLEQRVLREIGADR